MEHPARIRGRNGRNQTILQTQITSFSIQPSYGSMPSLRNKKWFLIYPVSIITLVVSNYCFTPPLEEQLQLFCTMDKAHVAEPPPTWVYPGYYWTNPSTGTNLTVIIIDEPIDGATALLYDNKENIFWIIDSTGPMRTAVYGPYQGILWGLTRATDPLTILGMTLSWIAIFYPPMGRTLRHNIEENRLFRKRK